MPSISRPAPARKTRIVALKISSAKLSQFTTASGSVTPAVQQESSESKTPEENSTPIPTDGDAQETNGAPAADKKKRPPPNPNARKRAPPAIDPDAPMRAPRPPQKKKAKLDTGEATDEAKQAANAANASAAHKLGPKANTGAINAGLRALDRSGKPCRRWEKKGLQLKSFTGSTWAMPTWSGSARPKLSVNGEMQSDSSSDIKPADASGLVSEKSASAIGETTMMTGLESSPAPAIAV